MATKKELIKEYKQMKFPIGIFQIRNLANGKVYVDKATNLNAIWNRHKLELSFGSHRNKDLLQDWKTFGEENFVYEILSELKQDEETTDYSRELAQLEEMYLDELQPYGEKGYNVPRKNASK